MNKVFILDKKIRLNKLLQYGKMRLSKIFVNEG